MTSSIQRGAFKWCDKPQLFQDLDGCLSAFDEAIDEQFPHIAELATQSRALQDKLPEPFKSSHYKDLPDLFHSHERLVIANSQIAYFKDFFYNMRSKLFACASEPGFFANLPKTPDADQLFDGIEKVCHSFGTRPHILTAPLLSSPTCIAEKKVWVDKHFGGRYGCFIAQNEKHEFAAPNHILIDDTPKKIRYWQEHGGIGILHTNATDSLDQLMFELTVLAKPKK